MHQMTVFVNLFQNLGCGYMKLFPEFQIESISAIEKKPRRLNKLVSKSGLKPGAPGVLPAPFDNIFLNLKANI